MQGIAYLDDSAQQAAKLTDVYALLSALCNG